MRSSTFVSYRIRIRSDASPLCASIWTRAVSTTSRSSRPEEGQRAACSDPDHPFVRATIATLRDVYGTEPLVAPTVGGTGPAAHVVNYLGIPFASIGCSYPGGRKHAPDENIRLDDFVRGATAIAEVLERYAQP